MNKCDKNLVLLQVIFVSALIVSNVVASRLMNVFGLIVPAAVVCYPITYLITDVIGELWGKEEANRTVVLGLIGSITSTILFLLSINIFIPVDVDFNNKVHQVLGINYLFTGASLICYLISQFLDVFIFHKIRDYVKSRLPDNWFAQRWMWNNGSTMLSQIVDTIIYITIAFGLGMGILFKNPLQILFMIFSQYIIKFCLALLDTPIFYILTRKSEER